MSASNTAKPRVAVVEDDKDLRNCVIDFLAFHDYPVWGVGSGEELLQRLAQEDVDVLLLDVGLPGEDGLAVARQMSGRASLAVFLVSGHASSDARQAGLDTGADGYLVKPIDLRALMTTIDAAWRRISRQRTP